VTRDVAIAGAEPVGATLALFVADADLDLAIVDARHEGDAGRDRALALSHGARLIFERLRLWTALCAQAGAVTPIAQIDISQARGFGGVRLDAAEQAVPALGYVVSYRALQRVLDEALARAGVVVAFGTRVRGVAASTDAATFELENAPPLRARLGVVADGAGTPIASIARQRHDYRQCAVVGEVWLDHPHGGVAYERFTADGPVALLPERDHYALVWTCAPDEASRLLQLPDDAFLGELSAHFGARVRRFVRVAERRAFPLALDVARNPTQPHLAVVGNAAQALHPIAGQGFNLGLRDAYDLARTILDTPRAQLGEPAMLARYRQRRTLDRRAGIAFTHGLVQLFGNDLPWLRVPRGLGMVALDTLPFAKRAFSRAMLYGLR
jgi:2-octaprenyl-6-methoxyphenol hydroxylase